MGWDNSGNVLGGAEDPPPLMTDFPMDRFSEYKPFQYIGGPFS